MILNFRFLVVPILILHLSSAVSTGAGAAPNPESSAPIQATATVVYPIGMAIPSDGNTQYLLYHPAGAGILISATGASSNVMIRATRDPISRLDTSKLIRSDTVTVIYTEN
jgi:hypothetical protein